MLKGSTKLEDYILIHSGAPSGRRAAAGVAVMTMQVIEERVHSYKFLNEQILTVGYITVRVFTTLVDFYIPDDGRKENSEESYETLHKVVNKKTKTIIYSRDVYKRQMYVCLFQLFMNQNLF